VREQVVRLKIKVGCNEEKHFFSRNSQCMTPFTAKTVKILSTPSRERKRGQTQINLFPAPRTWAFSNSNSFLWMSDGEISRCKFKLKVRAHSHAIFSCHITLNHLFFSAAHNAGLLSTRQKKYESAGGWRESGADHPSRLSIISCGRDTNYQPPPTTQ
jgi:hypothetical protein